MKKCIVCEKGLENEDLPITGTINPVYEATVWRSYGNYGSTVYDPLPKAVNEFLEICICDACLKAKQHLVSLVTVKVEKTGTEKPFVISESNSNPMATAERIAQLREQGLSFVKIAEQLGENVQMVRMFAKLMQLPDEMKKQVKFGKLSFFRALEYLAKQ